MSDFPMLPQHACSRPTHAVESQRDGGRRIQPVDVIERWALCHHLGCVVKYLAQTGGKSPSLEQPRLEQTRLNQTNLKQVHLEQTHLEQTRLEQAHLEQAHLEQTRLNTLRKAEWYLQRELDRSPQCPFVPMGSQPFTTEAVLDDWALSFHLSETLYHIKASKSPSMREESLRQALKHLQAEIATYDQETRETTNQETGGN